MCVIKIKANKAAYTTEKEALMSDDIQYIDDDDDGEKNYIF